MPKREKHGGKPSLSSNLSTSDTLGDRPTSRKIAELFLHTEDLLAIGTARFATPCARINAPKRRTSPMVVPWGHFLDAKNHKPPTFSRKIRGLRFRNLAVKERFEPAITQSAKQFTRCPRNDCFRPIAAIYEKPLPTPSGHSTDARQVVRDVRRRAD
jgi:hypothetical protein